MPDIDVEDVFDLLDQLDLEPTQRISTLISALEEGDEEGDDDSED